MAIIPNDEKFIGLSASVDTTERRSALINAESQAYTMQDITDTVSANIPAPTNPTSGVYPINRNGVFVNSGLSDALAAFGPFPNTGLKFYDSFSNLSPLVLNTVDGRYAFGNAFNDQFGPVANTGIAIRAGQMVMNCAISSGSEGVFKVNSGMGIIRVGISDSLGIGTYLFNASFLVGSGIMDVSQLESYNPNTPSRFIRVTNELGETFAMPIWNYVPAPPGGGGGTESGSGGGTE